MYDYDDFKFRKNIYDYNYECGLSEGEGRASTEIAYLENENDLLRDRIDELLHKINELQETLDSYRRGME